jgi:hypothetical protein
VRAQCRGQQRVRRGLSATSAAFLRTQAPHAFPSRTFFSAVRGPWRDSKFLGFLKPLDKLRKIGSVFANYN